MLLTKMVQLFINVLCPLAVGYALKRSGKMGPGANRALMLVNVYIVLTVMNLLSFWILPLNSSLLAIPLLSILAALISGGLGYFLFGRAFANILGWDFDLRKALFTKKQLSVVGVIIGVLFHVADISRPDAVGTFFRMMVHIRPWIVMVPVGYQMDFGNARLYYRKVLSIIPLRYIVVPGAISHQCCHYEYAV